MKKSFALILSLIMLFSVCTAVTVADGATANTTSVSSKKISNKERNNFYKKSAFIGSSLGVGQKMYFNRQGKNYLGKPKMLVKGCYSFHNDKNNVKKWMIHYGGKPMKAKNAIKKAKVKRVFIAMGTNDFVYGVDKVYKDYVDYLKGIRKTNPDVVIFIESTTGVTKRKQGKYLNSKNVTKLNKKMEKYCKTQKDMYFVDVSSKMLDKKGYLKKKYSSDNYVHLTNGGYKIWMDELIKYTDKLMLKEKEAESAVKYAEKHKNEYYINKSKQLVGALEKSTVKDKLTKRINKVVSSTTTTTTTTVAATE